MSRLHLTRRAVPLALAIGAALASPAAANHSPCQAMGGSLILNEYGPTDAIVCVYYGANGAAVGVDAIHECDATCTVGGARVTYDGSTIEACVSIIYEGTWIVHDRCVG